MIEEQQNRSDQGRLSTAASALVFPVQACRPALGETMLLDQVAPFRRTTPLEKLQITFPFSLRPRC
jgi:hypothetical protein